MTYTVAVYIDNIILKPCAWIVGYWYRPLACHIFFREQETIQGRRFKHVAPVILCAARGTFAISVLQLAVLHYLFSQSFFFEDNHLHLYFFSMFVFL